MTKRKVARVPEGHQSEGIQWLILEHDEADTGGVFVYCHRSLGDASEYDTWHQTAAAAMKEAERSWGVKVEDWLDE